MDRKKIEAKIADYQNQKRQLTSNIQQLQANLNAVEGALVDANYWLEEIKKEEAAEAVVCHEDQNGTQKA